MLCVNTRGVSSVGDAQGSGVRVYPVCDHTVVNHPAGWYAVARKQSHNARVSVMKLEQHKIDNECFLKSGFENCMATNRCSNDDSIYIFG